MAERRMANSAPLRICLTIYSSPWSALAGGGQMAVHEEATALYQRGHEVHVLYSRNRKEDIRPNADYHVHFTRQIHFLNFNWDFLSYAVSLVRLVRKYRFNIINTNAEEGLLSSWAARISGAVTVATLHACRLPSVSFFRRLIYEPRAAIRDLDYHLLRSTLLRADHIITLNKTSRDLVIDTFGNVKEKSVAVIPPGLDDSWFKAAREGNSSYEIITWSRLVAGKGIEDLLEAVALLRPVFPKIKLLICGDGEAADLHRDLVVKLDLSDRVEFTGFVSREKIQTRAARCRLAVFPSRAENSPRSVFEAAAMGLPVVSSNVGSVSERLEDGKSVLLFPPGDVDSLSRAISSLLSNAAFAGKVGEAARAANVLSTWEVSTANTENFYRLLIDANEYNGEASHAKAEA